MSLLSRLAARARSIILKSAEHLRLAPMYGLGSWFSKRGASQSRLMQEAVNWVFSCISRISETVISERLRLYRKKGAGPEDWEEITDSPFLDLLKRPNDWMPGSDLMQMWSQHEDLTGNAYWLLDGVKNETDMPTAIYPLNPAMVEVVIGEIPGKPDGIVGYKFLSAGSPKLLQPYEVLHFRRTNPNDPFRGLGPTEASMDGVDTDNWMREWNRRFFQNAAIPSAILETDDTSAEAIRLLRESFEDRHAGLERSHKVVALPRGVKFADKGYGQKDMDFVESRSKNRDEILAAFGVPPIVLGMGLGESINRATAETQEYVYAKYTIKPKLKRFEAYINEFFLARFGDDLAIEFDDPVPENTEQNLAKYQAALGGDPFMTVNEVRQSEGLPPIKGGDVVMGSAIRYPVGSPEKGKAARQKKARELPSAMKRKGKIDGLAEAVALAAAKSVKQIADSLKIKSIQDLGTADWSEMWKAFVGRTTPEEKRMRSAMSGYASDMAKRAEAAVRREFKGEKAVDISAILDRKDEIAAIVEIMDPIYLDILKKEGEVAAALVDSAFDETDKRMRKALDKAINLMARRYTDETLTVLKDRLESGLEEGEGVAALSDAVQEIGEWSATVRAERVARTEAFRTANFATKEAWKQSGVVKTIKWYTADDERVCEDCAAMDGKTVGIEENFLEKGDETATGVTINYADVEGGSLHPNCRCYVRPDNIEIG